MNIVHLRRYSHENQKNYLLLLAGIVWLTAGFNILRIGIISYKSYVTLFHLALFRSSIFPFLVHGFRETGPQAHRPDCPLRGRDAVYPKILFDRKSFIIMAFMMTFGIGLRTSGLCPDIFIAVFYSGLGTALVLAGLAFTGNYIIQAAGNRQHNPE